MAIVAHQTLCPPHQPMTPRLQTLRWSRHTWVVASTNLTGIAVVDVVVVVVAAAAAAAAAVAVVAAAAACHIATAAPAHLRKNRSQKIQRL